MLVTPQKTQLLQPIQRSDVDPATAAASAIQSGLMQNVQNIVTHQVNAATQHVSTKVSDNIDAAFAKTRVLLQANPPATSTPETSTAPEGGALAEFKDYMSKSPEERMRDSILKELGITEEEFEQMPPEKQQAIGQEIARLLQDKIKLAQAEKDSSATDAQVTDKFLAAV